MARFTIGDLVQTRKNGVGVVKTVWPKGIKVPAHYAVECDGLKSCVILEEHEITAAPPPISKDAVRCRDCAKGLRTHYISGAVRCQKFLQLRSAGSLRVCRHFQKKEA